ESRTLRGTIWALQLQSDSRQPNVVTSCYARVTAPCLARTASIWVRGRAPGTPRHAPRARAEAWLPPRQAPSVNSGGCGRVAIQPGDDGTEYQQQNAIEEDLFDDHSCGHRLHDEVNEVTRHDGQQ